MRLSLQMRLTLTTLVGFLLMVVAVNAASSLQLASFSASAKASLVRVEKGLGTTDQTAVRSDLAALTQLVDALPAKAGTASMLTGIVAAAVLGLLFLAVLNRYLLRPLELLAGYATRVGEGHVEPLAPDVRFAGRLGVLKDCLEAMVQVMENQLAQAKAKTAEVEAQGAAAEAAGREARRAGKKDEARRLGMLGAGETLENVADSIKKATSDLRAEAREVSGGAEEQKSCIDDTAAAVSVMVDSTVGVAKSAERAAAAAEEARMRATEGAAVVDDSVAAIGKVSSLAESLKGNMAELGRQAESIGQVMTVISDIADQTNLLALNAAIEAARAGDAGRGFAVVADEVRKLAEKTMTATAEVGQVIQAIQKGTFDNIRHMDQAADAVESATALAGQSRAALGEIVNFSGDAAAQVGSIASASDEQVAASERIQTAIDRIRDLSGRTTDGMVRSAATIEDLGGEIEELIKLNGVFKLIGQGTAQDVVEALAGVPEMASLSRESMERLMRKALSQNAFLELLYATDAAGVQITENIAPTGFHAKGSASVRGKNWSARPWFTGVMKNQDTSISPIYMSEASGEYCLTISTPIFAGDRILGVLGADIKVFG
ncbi:MAG: methyl-accepting chemotaxis protein [Solidesulfovibrio sp.]